MLERLNHGEFFILNYRSSVSRKLANDDFYNISLYKVCRNVIFVGTCFFQSRNLSLPRFLCSAKAAKEEKQMLEEKRSAALAKEQEEKERLLAEIKQML